MRKDHIDDLYEEDMKLFNGFGLSVQQAIEYHLQFR
jgi:hypothetical protein